MSGKPDDETDCGSWGRVIGFYRWLTITVLGRHGQNVKPSLTDSSTWLERAIGWAIGEYSQALNVLFLDRILIKLQKLNSERPE